MTITGNGSGYRNRASTSHIPTGSNPITEYMVVQPAHYNNQCCFDFGNMEATDNKRRQRSYVCAVLGNGRLRRSSCRTVGPG